LAFPLFSGFPILALVAFQVILPQGCCSVSTQTASSIISGVRNSSTHAPSVTAPGRLPIDEVVNTITHGIGIPLSLAGAVFLIGAAISTGEPLRILGCAIYCATLTGVYTASTLSHCFVCPKRRNFFRALDQALIYLLIAGSYTPFSLVYLKGPLWNAQLVLMWSIAIIGCISKLGFSHRINACRIWSYVLLAWLSAIPAFAMLGTVSLALHAWVFLGAAALMLGIVFFTLDIKRYHFHAMWHILVIAGTACHFTAIYLFVATLS
jgi:hemolysin III